MNNFTSGHEKNNQISSISFLTGTKNMAAILITVNIMEMVKVWTGIQQMMEGANKDRFPPTPSDIPSEMI